MLNLEGVRMRPGVRVVFRVDVFELVLCKVDWDRWSSGRWRVSR